MKNIPHEGLGRWMVAPWPRKEAKKAPITRQAPEQGSVGLKEGGGGNG